jgi:hypothetical protein
MPIIKFLEKAEPGVSRGRKAAGLTVEPTETAGLPGKRQPGFVFGEDLTMNRPILLRNFSSRLLIFSYIRYLAHDPT